MSAVNRARNSASQVGCGSELGEVGAVVLILVADTGAGLILHSSGIVLAYPECS